MTTGATERVATALADLSDNSTASTMAGAVTTRLVAYAVDLLTIVDAAGAIVVGDSAIRDMAVAPSRFRHLLTSQIVADDGPSVRCIRAGAPIDGWHPAARDGPDSPFASACRRDGFVSVQAVPMRARGRSIGSLTLFRRAPGALDPPAVTVAQALADTAAASMCQRWLLEQRDTQVAQLQQALRSRVLIEQAKGMIAERTGLAPEDAFDMIRGYARRRRLRLHHVAQLLVERAIDLDGRPE